MPGGTSAPVDGSGLANGSEPVSRHGWSIDAGDTDVRTDYRGLPGRGSESVGRGPQQSSGGRYESQSSEDEYLHGRILPPNTYPPGANYRSRQDYDGYNAGQANWHERRDSERGDFRGGPQTGDGYPPRLSEDFEAAADGWSMPRRRSGYSTETASGYGRDFDGDFRRAPDEGQWQAHEALWRGDGGARWSHDGGAQWSGGGTAAGSGYDVRPAGSGPHSDREYIATPDGRYASRAEPALPRPELALPELPRAELALPELPPPDVRLPEQSRPELALPELPPPDALPERSLPELPRPDYGPSQHADFAGDSSRPFDSPMPGSEPGRAVPSGPRTDEVPSSVTPSDHPATGLGREAEGRDELVPAQNSGAGSPASPVEGRDDDTVTTPLPAILPGAISVPRPDPVAAPRGFFEPARPDTSPGRPVSVTGMVEPPPVDYAAPVARPMSPAAEAKLDQLKDLYLTAQAIGEDALDKHFDQVSQRQRELIKEFFQRPDAGGPGNG